MRVVITPASRKYETVGEYVEALVAEGVDLTTVEAPEGSALANVIADHLAKQAKTRRRKKP